MTAYDMDEWGHAQLWDFLQERFGFGSWDESTADRPWWKFRANEIGKLKRMMARRRATVRDVVIAADYADTHDKPVTELWQLLDLINAGARWHRAITREGERAQRDVDLRTAIDEAVDADEHDWAGRLMRADPSEAQTVINQWRSR